MAKKDKKQPPKDVPSKKNLVVNKVKQHLMMKVSVPFFVIIIFISLFFIKVPYTARESYTELVPELRNVTKIVEDRDNPTYVRICQEDPLPSEIIVFEKPYGRKFGLTGYKCYGSFRLVNKGTMDGTWIVRYLLNISDKLIQTESVSQKIPKYTSFTFEFETEDCAEGDKVEGTYQIVKQPTTESCKYETQYNKTMTVEEEVTMEEQRERIITKYETLWEKFTGYNRFEKI